MLKLLLCFMFISPALLLPIIALSDAEMPTYESNFESVFIDPELQKIDHCKKANLDIYFHEDMLTTHSASYLAEGLNQLEACEIRAVEIVPVLNENPTQYDRDLLDARIAELVISLNTYQMNADILPLSITAESNALSLNGRAAIVKFLPSTLSPTS